MIGVYLATTGLAVFAAVIGALAWREGDRVAAAEDHEDAA